MELIYAIRKMNKAKVKLRTYIAQISKVMPPFMALYRAVYFPVVTVSKQEETQLQHIRGGYNFSKQKI